MEIEATMPKNLNFDFPFCWSGLDHLHSLNPPLIHKNFKTANCHVDEDFIPKVGDAGLRNLLDRIDGAASSSHITTDDLFLDPE